MPNAVPSIFEWNRNLQPGSKRKAPAERDPLPPLKRRRGKLAEEVGGDDDGEPSKVPAALSSSVSDTSRPSPSPFCATASVDHDYLPVLPDGNPLPPGVLEHIQKLEKENTSLREELASVKRKTISIESVKHNDEEFSACTGLPNYDVFEVLCDHLRPKAKALRWWRGKATIKLLCSKKKKGKQFLRPYVRGLSVEKQFFAVLFRLKTGVPAKIAAKHFGLSTSALSIMFTTWVNFLAHELEEMTAAVTTDLPFMSAPSFRDFPDTKMVIDCTEIFAERPSGLSARQQMFSAYKHHITIKFLVGCSMNGGINFVSSAWGGRASDKTITCDELLAKLHPGDAIMADRGFLVEEELRKRGCKLYIPAFKTASCVQLTGAVVTKTRRIARARIHIERAIQCIKTFQILKFMPLSLLHISEQII